jgi:hypothetical protein
MASKGDVVLYGLTGGDAGLILQRGGVPRGKQASAGDAQPALVVGTSGSTANLHVFLDGAATHFVSAVSEGDPGTPGAFWPLV